MKLITTIASLLICATLMATPMPPRGSDIQAIAGNCSVGPFGQTDDAGEYACNQLTAAEVCFAFIKGHIQENGDVQSVYDRAKATFCSRTLLNALITD